MKKLISILLSVLMFVLLFSSCTQKSKISVNGTNISDGVYFYFLQEVQNQNPDASEEEKQSNVNSMLCRYVAINSQFASEGLALTTAEKSSISHTVNSYWHLFEKHYTDSNITKQDLMKIEENKAYLEMLLNHRYSKNGQSPIDETELKKYFSENFIAFKALTGYLTTVNNSGEAVPLSDNEKGKLLSRFEKMMSEVNHGTPIDDVCSNIENTTFTSKTVVINKQNKTYPATFFDTVYAMGNDTAKSFTIGDYAFIVFRENLEEESSNFFATYKTECLKALKGDEFEKTVDEWTAAYSVDKT